MRSWDVPKIFFFCSLSYFSFLVCETQIIKIKSRLYYRKKEIGIQALKHSSSIFEIYILWGNKTETLSGCMVYRNCSQSGFAEAKEMKLKVYDKKKGIQGRKTPKMLKSFGKRNGWN